MSILQVNNQNFNYPDAGKEPGYGEDATAWAQQVTSVLDSVAGLGTINETQITLENDGTNRQLLGLTFNQNLTQAAEIEYRIFRKTDDVQYVEQGRISIGYNPAEVNKWFIIREAGPGVDTKVFIDVDATGQFFYNAEFIPGDNYEGYVRFKTYTTLK